MYGSVYHRLDVQALLDPPRIQHEHKQTRPTAAETKDGLGPLQPRTVWVVQEEVGDAVSLDIRGLGCRQRVRRSCGSGWFAWTACA